jgi:hypothetical protein
MDTRMTGEGIDVGQGEDRPTPLPPIRALPPARRRSLPAEPTLEQIAAAFAEECRASDERAATLQELLQHVTAELTASRALQKETLAELQRERRIKVPIWARLVMGTNSAGIILILVWLWCLAHGCR